MAEAFDLQEHYHVPIMAWYTPAKGKKVLSQLLELSLQNLTLNGAEAFPEGTHLQVDLQLPIFYPNLTRVQGEVIQSTEKIKGTLYWIELRYRPDQSEAASEISSFMDSLRDKIKPLKQKTPEQMPTEVAPVLSRESFSTLWQNLPSPLSTPPPMMNCQLHGKILMEEDESYPCQLIAAGPETLRVHAEERFFLNTRFQISLPFPTNTVRKSGSYSLTGEPDHSILNTSVQSTEAPTTTDEYTYDLKLGVLDTPTQNALHQYLFTLLQKELGRDTLEELLAKCISEAPSTEGAPTEEHRRWTRKQADLHGHLFDEIAFEQGDGRIQDLSMGGARLTVDHPFQPGTRVLLKFNTAEETYRLAATIRWLKSDEDSAAGHEVGLQFLLTDPVDQNNLEKVLGSL